MQEDHGKYPCSQALSAVDVRTLPHCRHFVLCHFFRQLNDDWKEKSWENDDNPWSCGFCGVSLRVEKGRGLKQAVRSWTNVWCGERLARLGGKKATYKRPGWLTAVKRMGMRNALVPGRRPRKFPAPKFNWNHCRTGVTRKKKIERQWLIW